jgi:hypothetical protein
MTTNVVVATYHGVVLGCDSLSSIVERAYFPFRTPDALARDADGNPMYDAQGRPLLVYSEANFVITPTNIMGGVQKMFVLFESGEQDDIDCSVAAITSGLGTLNGVVIAEIATRFRRNAKGFGRNYDTAEEVVRDFVSFVRPLWEQQTRFREADEAIRPMLDDLQFLVCGYGPDDEYTKVFRVSISEESMPEEFPTFPHCSAAWAGQSNAISSLVNGISHESIWTLRQALVSTLEDQRQSIVAEVVEQLKQQGVAIPEPFEAQIYAKVAGDLPWSSGAPAMDWANLPVQSAVDLVSTLVNAESAIQKFAMGIPTVGGRTRIGLMRRGMPFAFLNEPEIIHHHVGYNHDA